MREILTAGMAILGAGAAAAADKPAMAPPAAWVEPLQLLAASAGKTDGAPVRILLQDQQVFLERGRQTDGPPFPWTRV